jgi:hypothetical protein
MDGSILLQSNITPQALGGADTAGRAGRLLRHKVACPKSNTPVRRC